MAANPTTRPEDLDALEREWGLVLPSLLRTFLSTDCHFLETSGFFAVRSGDPLLVFRTTMAEPALFQAGLVPLGWGGDEAVGDTLYCLDPANMPDEDRCPVIALDYAAFSMDLDGGGDRPALPGISQAAAENLKSYAEHLFLP